MAATDGMRADWAQKDFYAVLGVSKSADAAEIKKAYRQLARENHPDSNPGDEAKAEKFKAVAEAYDVIGDPEKRKKYDEMRSLYASGGAGGGFGAGSQGGFDLNDLFGDRAGRGGPGGFGDVFTDLFGGGTRQRATQRPRKGQDVETNATISFTDAIDGVTVSMRLTSDAACGTCRGTGGKPGTKPHVCNVCDGAGTINTSAGAFSMNEPCPACGGRQLLYDEPCPTCGGSGRGTSARTIQARIPAGVKDGQKIRLKGKGGAGENGGPAGDLFVTVKVGKHRIFGRTGDNLTIDVPVAFDEAALGAEVKIPTLGGAPVTLKIPAGTPTGRTFRVRGKGVTRRDGTKGDLLATVVVQVPGTLSPAAREAVEAYREATADRRLRTNLFEEG
ncbi:molecular chaperone DnaJ [Nocardioides jishulii]|uniref:Chaperone protein DnaJ n=1 Tax=Nocardioides jishulii TaxID=2575440 RepID=A0A4U2YUS3_9ACTN|nr:molecular chaperone DnaJ [Nocardioides jishulii]QCX26354.1 molecular chaperone DnaJ [Nocardioides jishulii]TKI63841.1 molecular chaperone DnaJ [Nocardioides jishulii]